MRTLEDQTPATEGNEAVQLRNRLVASLVRFAGDELVLAQVERNRALFAVSTTGAPLVLATYLGEAPEAFANRLVAVAESHAGTLYIVVVGGPQAELEKALADVARRAPDLRSLGLYHATGEGELLHIDGRHLGALEAAGKKLGEVGPVTEDDLRKLAEEARRQHAEAVKFSQQTRRFPVVSMILGAVSVLVFLRVGAPGSGAMANAVYLAGANMGEAVRAGEVWRLLSSAFLHGSQMHLLVNMVSLYFLGTFLEQVVGRSRYLLVYGLAALGGSLASALLSNVASVGASGAIWGLMTAGFGLSLRPGGLLPPLIASRIKRALATPLLLNIGLSFLPDIDFRAHFGGGAVGILLAVSGWLGNKPKPDPASAAAVSQGGPVPTPAWVRVAAVLVALALAASLGLALWNAQALLADPAFRPTGTAGTL